MVLVPQRGEPEKRGRIASLPRSLPRADKAVFADRARAMRGLMNSTHPAPTREVVYLTFPCDMHRARRIAQSSGSSRLICGPMGGPLC